ncbi:MAG: hypothetical protein FWD37_05110 [Methanomassiliicoccaceae archaeon]|nr:hypothetical protein [Methanomassiliicoccaceae archaeon]
MNGKIFSESQTVMPRLILLAVAVLLIGLLIFFMYVTTVDESIPVDSIEGITLIGSLALIVVVMFALFFIKLNVSVTSDSLIIGIFKGRTIPLKDIEKVTPEDFSAFRDFFGWGIKVGKKGLGYIVADTNKGLRIHFKTGKSFLISTKRQFEFESAMRTALKNLK